MRDETKEFIFAVAAVAICLIVLITQVKSCKVTEMELNNPGIANGL